MAGIAGIAAKGTSSGVSEMLDKMNHRGNTEKAILEREEVTLGITWNESEDSHVSKYLASDIVCDYKGPDHFAWAKPEKGFFKLHRDELGVSPLYYGWDNNGIFYFASEVKALALFINTVNELTPGNDFDTRGSHTYFELELNLNPSDDSPERIARLLKKTLENSVKGFINTDNIGSWLSGGLDSSVICSIAAKNIKNFKTFAAGVKGAPDLVHASEVSAFIRSEHHELVVSVYDMVRHLPDVIYHLESFDALLVRSSITNFLVGKLASQYVSEVFSGEGGDELFAGYDYLKLIPLALLPSELVKITGNLHNTALQRVDRCSSANGTAAHVPFLTPEMVKLAFSIPARYKLHNNTEKWILRKAFEGDLPENILRRPKAKFWDGAGVRDAISSYAEKKISDTDFARNRELSNGWILNTKEELLYYNIFRGHFGNDLNLNWMGRTERSPVS